MTLAASRAIAYISRIDHQIMIRANRWSAPRWMRHWMICATRGGDGWLWYALALAVGLFGGERRWAVLASAALSASVGIALFVVVKHWIRRPRPCAHHAHCWAKLLPPDHFSFPSGHTITAFAVATPVAAAYPALFVGLLFCALSVAASRILLGMHYLSDVAAGAALGILLGVSSHMMML